VTQKEAFGWVMFSMGFLAASATAMHHPPLWKGFVPALLLSFVGAGVARSGAHGAHVDTAADGKDAVGGSRDAAVLLRAMVDELDRLDAKAGYDSVKQAIENLQYCLVATFVDERRRYLADYGPVVFAHFFGAFARGERNLNRAWSALVDGHQDEVLESLRKARAAMTESLTILEQEA